MFDGEVRSELKAPFPWFGGKSRVAPQVWDAFGDVPNYVEPFFGSGAVLLARPQGKEMVLRMQCASEFGSRRIV